MIAAATRCAAILVTPAAARVIERQAGNGRALRRASEPASVMHSGDLHAGHGRLPRPLRQCGGHSMRAALRAARVIDGEGARLPRSPKQRAHAGRAVLSGDCGRRLGNHADYAWHRGELPTSKRSGYATGLLPEAGGSPALNSRGDARTRRLDDLGSVQDGRKMSTDGRRGDAGCTSYVSSPTEKARSLAWEAGAETRQLTSGSCGNVRAVCVPGSAEEFGVRLPRQCWWSMPCGESLRTTDGRDQHEFSSSGGLGIHEPGSTMLQGRARARVTCLAATRCNFGAMA